MKRPRNCNNCAYFVPQALDQDHKAGGECRKLPPRIGDALCGEFPAVPNGSTWFCGSHYYGDQGDQGDFHTVTVCVYSLEPGD